MHDAAPMSELDAFLLACRKALHLTLAAVERAHIGFGALGHIT